jgi:hypothetical protein
VKKRFGMMRIGIGIYHGLLCLLSEFTPQQHRAASMAINVSVVDVLHFWVVWWLLLAKLPTRMALVRKGIAVNSGEFCCALYSIKDKAIDHLFFNCSFLSRV